MTGFFFEEFTPGRRFESPGITVTESQILDFAMLYDPQPFHVDVEAARTGPFAGLIASGFQTLALSFRAMYQTGWMNDTGLGAFGLDQLRWPVPVRPGDTLRVTAEVVEARVSGSKPDRGFVRVRYETRNQAGEVVMEFTANQIMRRRPT